MTLTSFLTSGDTFDIGAVVTSSHNAAAERQFRMPIEYGGVRSEAAQWTATAAGAFILGKGKGEVLIKEYMPGRIIDGSTADGSNMGGAMSFAAADSIISYFEESGESPEQFDYIVTGDLGKVGSSVLRDILFERMPRAERRHTDCGLLLYDLVSQDCHSGASGCGTSAAVLALEFLPAMMRSDIGDILFLSTGALMNPTSLLHGENIFGIAPIIRIGKRKD
jgi:stage V sporulation protein AD